MLLVVKTYKRLNKGIFLWRLDVDRKEMYCTLNNQIHYPILAHLHTWALNIYVPYLYYAKLSLVWEPLRKLSFSPLFPNEFSEK